MDLGATAPCEKGLPSPHTNELPLLRKTTELHRDAAEIIALREDLRLHITALRRFSVLVSAQGSMMVKLGLIYGKGKTSRHVMHEELEEQVGDCLQICYIGRRARLLPTSSWR